MIIPFLSAIALGASTVLEKTILKKKKVNEKIFIVATFFTAVILMIPLLYFFGGVDYSRALQTASIITALVIIFLSFIANYFLYYSIKGEKISNIEPAFITVPLFTILIAIFFSLIFGTTLYERNLKVIIPALIAGATLVFSQIKHKHLQYNKYFLAAILASFLIALETTATRLVLEYYSPMAFYFIRGIGIFTLGLLVFKPGLSKIDKKTGLQIFATAIVWISYRVLLYYGFLVSSVIFTTLIVMLAPVFVYLFAYIFLEDKPSKRNLIASVIIIVAVLYAVLS